MIDWSTVPRLTAHRQLVERPHWFNGWRFGSIAVDPRGRYILTAGERGLRLHQAASGELIRTFEGLGNGGSPADRIGFTGDGERAIAQCGGALGPSAIGVWEVSSGARLNLLDQSGGGKISAIDGEGRLALARDRQAEASLWDLEAGRVLRTLKPRPDGGLSAAAFAGTGRAVAVLDRLSGSAGRTGVGLWNLLTGEVVWRREVEGVVAALAAPADGSWFAAGGSGTRVDLYRTETGEPLFSLDQPAHIAGFPWTHSLVASAKGRRLLAVMNGHLHVWEVESRRLVASHDFRKTDVVATFSPDGSWVVAGGPDGWIWRVDLDGPQQPVVDRREPVTRLAWSTDGLVEDPAAQPGPTVATATPPSWLPRLDAAIGKLESRLDGGGAWGTVIGSTLAATVIEGEVAVFDLDASPQNPLQELDVGWAPGSNGGGNVAAIALHPDGRRLAIGSSRWDAPLQIWDARAGVPLAVLEGHEAAVTALAFSPDGSLLASASRDLTVRVWTL